MLKTDAIQSNTERGRTENWLSKSLRLPQQLQQSMLLIRFSYIGTALMVLLASYIMIARPIQGLAEQGQLMLGALILALCIWIFKPFGLTYAIGGLVITITGLLVGLETTVVFSGFTQSSLWTLIPAFFFGYTLQKTGLGRRIAMAVIRLCKPTFTSLVLAWIPIGVVLALLTPATTVRVAIMIPIAVQCCELFGIKKGSKGNSLLILTAFAMALIPGSGWLTGIIWGPFIQGQFEASGMHGMINFMSWIQVLLLPIGIITALLVGLGLFFFKSEDKITREAFLSVRNQHLEPISRKERITAIILIAVFVASLTSNLHGISTAVICMLAMVSFFLFQVLETKDFNVAANWNLVIFIAVALSLGSIFASTGISTWLSGVVVPLLAPIMSNPWIFVLSIMTFMFLWSLVDVAMFIPTIAIMVPILPDIQAAYQIHPMVWVAMFILAGNAFFLAYQNMWAVMSQSIARERQHHWKDKHLSMYGVLYYISCMIALLITMPLWIHLGLFT